MIVRRAQPCESRAVSAWIKERHYSKTTPPGYVCALEFLEGREVVGAMLLGRPASRAYDADLILELTRVYFVDSAPPNTESHGLAMMRKYVRTWYPQIRLLISYSDPKYHDGTIYEADNWAPFGLTKPRNGDVGWQSRPNRTEDLSRKQRWVRTP